MNLFHSAPPTSLEKVAAAYPLVGRPENWEGEILAILHKQAPYLGQYRVDLSIAQENREAGFLLGYFIISPQASPQASMQSQPMQSAGEVDQGVVSGETVGVRIPVIVVRTSTSTILKPFDIMMDEKGQCQPLTESRLASKMADAGQYEAVKAPAGVEGMTPNEPPQQQGSGVIQSFDKTASYPMLSKIARGMTDTDVDAFKAHLADPEVLYAIQHNPAFREAALMLVYGQEKVATSVDAAQHITPTVVVVKQASRGYDVLSASHHAYEPVRSFVPYERAYELSMDVLQAVAEEGSVMFNQIDPERRDTAVGSVYATEVGVTKEAGRHQVTCVSGVEDCRLVPSVFGLNGNETGEVLLLKQASTQGAHSCALTYKAPVVKLAAMEKVASASSWVPWNGGGTVSFVAPDLSAATEPLSGTMVKTARGERQLLTKSGVSVVKMAQLVRPYRMDRSLYIPESWVGLSVREGLQPVDAELYKTAALAKAAEHDLHVLNYGGSTFHFRGHAVSDLDEKYTTDLDTNSSLLLLGAAGFALNEGELILKTAAAQGRKACSASRKIRSMGKAKMAAMEKVAARIKNTVPKINLIKEAASLATPQAIDTVLSLNFVTPENLEMFLNKRPDLEASLRTLCDLLLQCRLGLEDVKEAAVERSVKGITDVLTGLDAAEMRMQAP